MSHTSKVFIASPTESRMSKRANRHPKLAEFLAKAGHEVEYITGNFSHAYKVHYSEEEIELSKKAEPYKLTVLKIWGYKKNISIRRVFCHFFMALKYFIYLFRASKRGDVLVVASRPVEMVFMAAILKTLKKLSVVMDIRDIWPDALVTSNKIQQLFFRAYCNFYLRLSIKKIDKFVHVSPSFCKWLKRYAPQANSLFVPLGYDRKRWETIQPKRCFGNNICLVYVGLLQFQIDVMPVLEALVSRKNFTFIVIGDDGNGQRFQEVQNFIKKHDMNNVSIVGRLSPEKVVEHLKNKDIGIVPMIASSIPNKVFDYIGARIPVISLGDKDASEFVREYDIGWVAPFDAKGVGDLLDSLSGDEILRKAKNVEKIRDKFARDNLFKEFIELIEST